MSRPPKPGDRPWMMPYLAVSDVEKSLDFYKQAFGFEEIRALAGPDGRLAHAGLRWHDTRILIGSEDREKIGKLESPIGHTPKALRGTPIVLYLYTEDVDALYRRAIEAGALDGYPPDEMPWGDRVCLLFDADGHAWNFATNVRDDPYAPGSA
jgi:PhnB protein